MVNPPFSSGSKLMPADDRKRAGESHPDLTSRVNAQIPDRAFKPVQTTTSRVLQDKGSGADELATDR